MCREDRSFIHELRRMRVIISALSTMEEAINAADLSPFAKAVAYDMVCAYAAQLVDAYKKHPEEA